MMAATTTPATPESELTPELIDRVLKLSPESLGRLVTLALERLGPPADDPAEVKAAWREEIARRWKEIETGQVELLDARESAARLRQHLREKFGT